jgi:hypothetical protein
MLSQEYLINNYKRNITSDRQSFQAYIKRNGYKENLGQIELGRFKDSVNKNISRYTDQCNLITAYENMLDNL